MKLLYFASVLVFVVTEDDFDVDPSLENCMNEILPVTDTTYSSVFAYFRMCKELGHVAKDEVPDAYFTETARNLKDSFKVFWSVTALPPEELETVKEEFCELVGDILHASVNKRRRTTCKGKATTECSTLKHTKKRLFNTTSNTTRVNDTMRVQVINNIWPHQLYNINATEPKPSRKYFANTIEVSTLAVVVLILLLVICMAFKIFTQLDRNNFGSSPVNLDNIVLGERIPLCRTDSLSERRSSVMK